MAGSGFGCQRAPCNRAPGASPVMDRQSKIILLGCCEAETGKLRDLLARHAIVKCARDLPELLIILKTGDCDALFCDSSFPVGTWREALEAIQKRDQDLPMIVVDHAGEEKEWIDVLSAGAFDLLAPPYNEPLVLAVLEHAIVSCEARKAHASAA